MPISVDMAGQRHSLIFISFIPKMSVFLLCLVLSREWGNGLRGLPYMVRRSVAPPPSPPKGKWSGYRVGPPLPCGVGCGALFPLWGGCGVLGFRV